jgi:Ca2+-binding EF-hand superfamily protein
MSHCTHPQVFDLNKDGKISTKELLDTFATLGINIDAEMVDHMIQATDLVRARPRPPP